MHASKPARPRRANTVVPEAFESWYRHTEALNSKKGLAIVGLVVGAFIAILAASGNPANMAICAACFIRDMAGALKLHTAGTVQYFRPEIVGFVFGSFLIALATREYRSTAGSSPMIRFVLSASS